MVEIEPAQFLSIPDKGDLSDPLFADRIQALYATAYAVKFICKGLDLHFGPFATEPETLEQMHAFMQLQKLVKNGLHHEIYLSDFNKTAPDRLKTILREPVK